MYIFGILMIKQTINLHYFYVFIDRDVQCDFNNPFYEENECGWKFSQKTMTTLGLGNIKRFTRELLVSSSEQSMNYFRRHDSMFGKPMI